MDLLLQLIVLLIAIVSITLLFRAKSLKQKSQHAADLNQIENNHREKINDFEKEQILSSERIKTLNSQLLDSNNAIVEIRKQNTDLTAINASLESQNQHLREKFIEQKSEFERLQKQATIQFENLANEILKRNTEEFSVVNQKKINDLILPLRERIQGFEKKVEETYEKGLKDQTDLKAELKKLYDLNSRMTNEANNLTKALKGDVKKQGNWGEIVLERILERSGLTEGQEFQREVVGHNAEGKLIRPDVIVNLPDKKHIIVDSKVSLVAYERFVNTDLQNEKDKHLKEHLSSLKKHVKELNQKHYTSSPDFNCPDFVLLFVPIESSFSVAIEEDQQLFNYAWENKVVIVSPSTLLATLRTIASIWQQENQTRNAIEIAKQSGLLYDKFVGFLEDIETIGKNINTLQGTYEKATNKLSNGTGNLVRRVEKLKELGAKASKEIPAKFID